MLAICFQVSTPGVIDPWEAGILFSMYFGYVFLMYINVTLFRVSAVPHLFARISVPFGMILCVAS